MRAADRGGAGDRGREVVREAGADRLSAAGRTRATPHPGAAMRFIVLLGLVSLFADMTYEGARSATGPFLQSLGASAAVVGVVAGIGELAGYALRLGSGYLADRWPRHWLLTGAGYAVNLLAVPLLALAHRWETAAVLVAAERVGKAVRTPARDVMLSYAAHGVGRGWGFGLHEALDQVGAVAGPLLVAGVLALGLGYRAGFALLLVPAVLALALLAAARIMVPHPAAFEEGPGDEPGAGARGSGARAGEVRGAGGAEEASGRRGRPAVHLGRPFWLYTAFTAVSVAGFAHFQLMSFHFKAQELLTSAAVSVSLAAAMAVDAVAAVAIGKWYDRAGMGLLAMVPVGTAIASVLAFEGTPQAVWAGTVVWGAVMGVQETVMRAAVADLVPAASRGTAYGLFNAMFGLAWFAGSSLMGLLYERSPGHVAAFSVAAQLASLPALAAMLRAVPAGKRASAKGDG